MSENACCAHSKVVPKKTYDAPGHVIAETWACINCGTEFTTRTSLAEAEEELAWEMNARMDAEKKVGSDFYAIAWQTADADRTRLTAEVEEWKKRAEKLENDVAFADGFATAAGRRNVRLMAELRTLRRTSVRVDVLLRWIQSVEDNYEEHQMGMLVDRIVRRLEHRLTRRSSRGEEGRS